MTEALAAYRLARADQEALAAAPGAPPEARRDLGDTVNRHRPAAGEYRPARRRRRPSTARPWRSAGSWPRSNPAVAEYRNSLAASHNNLGILLLKSGPVEGGGGRVPHGAGDPRRSWPTDNPAVTEFRKQLQASHFNLGNLLGRRAGGRRRRTCSARPWRSSAA